MGEVEEALEIDLDEFLEDWYLQVRSIKSYDKGVRVWLDYVVDEDEDEEESEEEDED